MERNVHFGCILIAVKIYHVWATEFPEKILQNIWKHNNQIDLSLPLQLFENCSVHIIHNTVKSNDSLFTENYNIIPNPIPVVLSTFQYVPGKLGNLYCDKLGPLLPETNSELKFTAPPQYRLSCIAQFYIDPKSCKNWYSKIIRKEAFKTTTNTYRSVLPSTIFNTVFDSRFAIWKGAIEQVLVKHHWLFIHIQLKLNANQTHSKWDDIFFSVDYGGHPMSRIACTSPFKMVLLMSYNKHTSSYLVEQAYLASFSENVKPLYTAIQKSCRLLSLQTTKVDLPKQTQECVDRIFQQNLNMPWKYIDLKVATAGIGIWKIMNEMYLKTQSSLVIALAGISFEERSGNVKDATSKAMLQYIFPNSTFVSAVHNILSGYQVIPTLDVHHIQLHSLTVFYDNPNPMHFLSCTKHRNTESLNLVGFSSAFTWQVWFVWCICSLISTAIVRISKPLLVNRFHGIVFVYMLFLGEKCPKSIKKHFKFLFLGWIIATLVISNAYQGSNITRITKPLVIKHLESFEELVSVNVTFYSPPYPEYVKIVKSVLDIIAKVAKTRPEFAKNISTRYEKAERENFKKRGLDVFFTKFEMYLGIEMQAIVDKLYLPKTRKDKMVGVLKLLKKSNDFSELLSMNNSSYFFNKLEKCQDSAFIDNLDEVAKLYYNLKMELKENEDDLYISPKPYQKLYVVLSFGGIPLLPVRFLSRVQSLFQFGLMELWTSRAKRVTARIVDSLHNRKHVSVKPMSLNGNLVLLFYTLIASFILSSAVFLYRLRFSYVILLRQAYYFVMRQVISNSVMSL